MNRPELKDYIVPGRHGHLIGIGGVSMAPLAEVLHGAGLEITGSDMNDSPAVEHLRQIGIPIVIGHRAENLAGVDYIIRTAAAREDNPEIRAAREMGIPVFERAQAWGHIMRDYPNALCISGTHGKTTTTSMCTHILMEAGRDPTVMIGGTLSLLHAGHRVGKGDTIVMESCEYYDSFLSFYPTVAVILVVEADHLDYFKDLEDVKKSFRTFALHVPEGGTVIANGEDQNTMDAIRGIDRRVMTFGFGPGMDVRAVNLESRGRHQSFDVLYRGEAWGHIELNLPGRHNVADALAACASAIALGVEHGAAERGLAAFTGAARRFECKGEYNGADVYDDYAHHPGELSALLDMAESMGYRRVIVAFQPHTYSRTKALFGDFVSQLRRADRLYLAEIYAAREQNTVGISSADLASEIPGAVFCPTFEDLEEKLRAEAGPGDLVLTVGAGDIYKVGDRLVQG